MKENQRVALTKRLLQEGLFRLLEEKPLEKVKVTELCREAGINRATFYRHYTAPRDVLLDMEAEFDAKLSATYTAADKQDVPRTIEALTTHLHCHRALLKVFLQNNSADEFLLLLTKIFDTCIRGAEGFSYLAEADEESLKLLTAYITGGGYYMLRQRLLEDIQKSPQEIAALVLRLMNYTVADGDSKERPQRL